jgi:hypothetical protein
MTRHIRIIYPNFIFPENEECCMISRQEILVSALKVAKKLMYPWTLIVLHWLSICFRAEAHARCASVLRFRGIICTRMWNTMKRLEPKPKNIRYCPMNHWIEAFATS